VYREPNARTQRRQARAVALQETEAGAVVTGNSAPEMHPSIYLSPPGGRHPLSCLLAFSPAIKSYTVSSPSFDMRVARDALHACGGAALVRHAARRRAHSRPTGPAAPLALSLYCLAGEAVAPLARDPPVQLRLAALPPPPSPPHVRLCDSYQAASYPTRPRACLCDSSRCRRATRPSGGKPSPARSHSACRHGPSPPTCCGCTAPRWARASLRCRSCARCWRVTPPPPCS
jgi:hypothetical protein